MKKLNLVYNHNIFDESWRQSEVKKLEQEIKNLLGDDVQISVTSANLKSPNSYDDESNLIRAEHSFDISVEDMKALSVLLVPGVLKIKAVDPMSMVVSFKKLEEDNL